MDLSSFDTATPTISALLAALPGRPGSAVKNDVISEIWARLVSVPAALRDEKCLDQAFSDFELGLIEQIQKLGKHDPARGPKFNQLLVSSSKKIIAYFRATLGQDWEDGYNILVEKALKAIDGFNPNLSRRYIQFLWWPAKQTAADLRNKGKAQPAPLPPPAPAPSGPGVAQYNRLISALLSASIPPQQLIAFLFLHPIGWTPSDFVKTRWENAFPLLPGDVRTTLLSIIPKLLQNGTPFNTPFHVLVNVFIWDYSRKSTMPKDKIMRLFAPLHTILKHTGTTNKSFAHYPTTKAPGPFISQCSDSANKALTAQLMSPLPHSTRPPAPSKPPGASK